MILREAVPADAESLAELIADAEKSGYMLFEPGERKITADQLSKRIESMVNAETSAILLAEVQGDLKGYLFIIGNHALRGRHNVYLAAGVSGESRGQGVGTFLFEGLDRWAVGKSIHRIELTVMVQNRPALALYQKAGFKIEGIKKNSLKVDGFYIDEYYMAKLM